MGLQSAPGYIGQGGYQTPVELDRNFQAAAAGRRTGAYRYGDFALTPSASAMQMTIARGDAFILGANSNTQGGYFVWSNASETISWPAAAGSPRIDTLLCRVVDTQYGVDAGGNGAVWQVHTGVPSGSPVALADSQFAPGGALARPGGWWRVADVLVPASVTNLSTATITNTRQYARIGRYTMALSTNLPTDAQLGDQVSVIDNGGAVMVYDGALWRSIEGAGGWLSLGSYYGSGYQAHNIGYSPSYSLRGQTVRLRGQIVKTSGTITTGSVVLNLPVSLRPAANLYFSQATSAVGSANTLTRVDVATTGAVTLTFTQGNASAFAPTWVSLDGIIYDVN